MKKLPFISISLLLTVCLFWASCSNTDSDSAMQSPVVSNSSAARQKAVAEIERTAVAPPLSAANSASAKAKTIENLQAAFKGETTASARYAAYSKQAEEDGYHEIALLFKAASVSENIHANNHKAVLQESGVNTPLITPQFTVNTTTENLQDAITGEAYEVSTMYPEFLAKANEAGNQLALISFNYAYKTEKKHKVLYEAALTALQNNTVKTLAAIYYVCPTCGNTYDNKAPARCGISLTGKEKFITINSL